MADKNVGKLVAPLVEAFQKCEIALSQAEAEYNAAVQHGIFPDLAYDIALENYRTAQENCAKVGLHVVACAAKMIQESITSQADATGSSSSQPAPVLQQQDNHGADASEERKSDVSQEPSSDASENLFDLDMNKFGKGEERKSYASDASLQELERIMTAAPDESVEGNKAVLEGSVEQNTAAPEETVKDSATSEETLESNMVAPEETVERDTASQEEEVAEGNTIAPEETVECNTDAPEGEEECWF